MYCRIRFLAGTCQSEPILYYQGQLVAPLLKALDSTLHVPNMPAQEIIPDDNRKKSLTSWYLDGARLFHAPQAEGVENLHFACQYILFCLEECLTPRVS